ncbi:MAG: hypothetical protein BWY06_02574 [Candidatus Latescibacteria bacterium ADurb.Bin168]|nr:MAG: hypothetical protein BWY06_02574 [Candidatus Latescibacteria bacterium ADurb.Bin168]
MAFHRCVLARVAPVGSGSGGIVAIQVVEQGDRVQRGAPRLDIHAFVILADLFRAGGVVVPVVVRLPEDHLVNGLARHRKRCRIGKNRVAIALAVVHEAGVEQHVVLMSSGDAVPILTTAILDALAEPPYCVNRLFRHKGRIHHRGRTRAHTRVIRVRSRTGTGEELQRGIARHNRRTRPAENFLAPDREVVVTLFGDIHAIVRVIHAAEAVGRRVLQCGVQRACPVRCGEIHAELLHLADPPALHRIVTIGSRGDAGGVDRARARPALGSVVLRMVPDSAKVHDRLRRVCHYR